MKKLNILVTLLTISLLSHSAFADSEKGMRRKGHFKQMVAELNLTKDQIQKLSEYRKKNKGVMREIRKERKTLKESMKNAFISKASSTKLEAMHTKMGELHQKSSDLKFKKMLFLKDLLSKEQREDFMARKKRKHRRD